MRILSLDPGVTTGWCLGVIDDGLLRLRPGEDRWSHLELAGIIESFIGADNGNKHIIYETFQYRNNPRPGLDLTPVEMIGVIKLYRLQYEPMVGFHEQTPAQGKAFYTDEVLKRLGVYAVGKKHGRDATRHMLHWLNFGPGGQYIDINNTPMELE